MKNIFSNIKKNCSKEIFGLKKLYYIVIFVFIFGLIGHAYGFLDFNFSHDSSIMVQSDSIWQIMIGRFLQPIYVSIRGELFSPFLVGILSLVYISIAAYLITDIFNIKSIGGVILTAGILSTNSVVTLISGTYIYLIDVFMLSLMCSCIGAYYCIKFKNKNVLAVIFLVISLGLYQSYWQVAILILMLNLIQDILSKVESRDILKKTIRYILILISSIVLYYILMKVFQIIYNVSGINSYNSIPSLSTYLDITNDIKLIKGAYTGFIRYYIHPSIHKEWLVALLTIICFSVNGLVIFAGSIKNKLSFSNYIVLIIITLLLPLGGNIVYVITQGMEHGLMLYSFFIPYVFCIAIFENNSIKFKNYTKFLYCSVSIITISILIFNGIIYSNQVYMKKHVEYNYTYATLNRIISKIEETDNYDPNTSQVVFIGSLEKSKISTTKKYFNYTDVGLGGNFAVTYLDTYKSFINNIMGYPMNIVTDEQEIKRIQKNKKVKDLPAFPSKDYITIVDDKIIVKLSEIE